MQRMLRLLMIGTLCLLPLLAAAHFEESLAVMADYEWDDYVAVYETWRRIAEQPQAQCNLGMMYAGGYGVARDAAEAVRWFRKAAEQGYAEAQYQLGIRYAFGKGVRQDKVEAFAWVTVAATEGIEKVKAYLAPRMTPDQAAAARELARVYRQAYVVPFEAARAEVLEEKRSAQPEPYDEVGGVIVAYHAAGYDWREIADHLNAGGGSWRSEQVRQIARRLARRVLASRMTCNGTVAAATN